MDGVPTPSVKEDKLTSNAVIRNKITRSGAVNGSCPAAWDSLFCWPPTPAGQTASFPCTHIFPFLRTDNATAVAFRRCDALGRWTDGGWTNYSRCETLDALQEEGESAPSAVSALVFAISFLSLVSLCAALFIFTAFRSLECPRVRVHRQLVLSLLAHALLLMAIASAGLHPGPGVLLRNTDWLCKALLVLRTYSAMASVHWMFVEGLLLHASVTTSVFDRHPPFALYYTLGWGVPAVCVLLWIILMSSQWNKACWEGYGRSSIVWFVTGPMIIALLVNAVFLVNIVRILVTKMRSNVAIETKQIRKAIRATALLFPLLGITHLLFCINPGGEWEPLYMFVNALLQSSQGLFVAILYCFLNTEVQSVLRMAYSRRRSSTWRHRSSRALGTSLTTQLPPSPPVRPEEETALA
ncbi:PDF receptor [Trichonephila clavata]|uniref:PDF receptor n=1 Tax=Trichonephila clavata TaxID=2740835 RepID=A0A8X6LLP2_TRICU|nr:PDF receptor [Trichonephila clavata]